MKQGNLYVVATPIGHLGDLTHRAREILSAVHVIAAEDTRHTKKLLQEYGIEKPLIAYHDHNEREMVTRIVERMANGDDVALVSDAGTPLLNDPGYHLVKGVIDAGMHAIAVPGPSSITALLSISGLPADRFVYEGFLPPKTAARQKRLRELAGESRSMVFLESPRRLCDFLQDAALILGARQAVVGRELTKIHEEIRRGNLAQLQLEFAARERIRGEIIIQVAGNSISSTQDWSEACRMASILATELPKNVAAKLCARLTGQNKQQLYQWLVSHG